MSALSRKDALLELDLDGTPPDTAISVAFRRKAKALNTEVTAADMEGALRRLIEARERLMTDMRAKEPAYEPVEQTICDAIPLKISLRDALKGGVIVRELPVQPMPIPEQVASHNSAPVTLQLKAGLRPDEVVSLAVSEAETRRFRIQIVAEDSVNVFGNDIWMQAEIDAALMRNGGRTDIQIPHGPIEIEVARGCVAGSCLTLSGLGLPATDTHPAGKLYIRLEAGQETVRPYAELAAQFRHKWLSPQAA